MIEVSRLEKEPPEIHTYACLRCGFRLRMIVEPGAGLLAAHCEGAPWIACSEQAEAS